MQRCRKIQILNTNTMISVFHPFFFFLKTHFVLNMQTEEAPRGEHGAGVQTPSGLALLIHILTGALGEQPAYQSAERTGQKRRAKA